MKKEIALAAAIVAASFLNGCRTPAPDIDKNWDSDPAKVKESAETVIRLRNQIHGQTNAPELLSIMSRAEPLSIIQSPPTSAILIPDSEITLEWNQNPEDVAGYRIYYGSNPHDYDHLIEAGTNLSATVTNLEIGRAYYFTMTDYFTNGAESDFSSQLACVTSRLIQLTFRFDGPVSSATIQSSSDLMSWKSSNVKPIIASDNTATVRAVVNSPAAFFRAVSP